MGSGLKFTGYDVKNTPGPGDHDIPCFTDGRIGRR